uniref:Uncharacterized protein n=1 Tax=Photinus pyralis TaxID=7054 RepID=A0A1Y1NIF7_PHOPY
MYKCTFTSTHLFLLEFCPKFAKPFIGASLFGQNSKKKCIFDSNTSSQMDGRMHKQTKRRLYDYTNLKNFPYMYVSTQFFYTAQDGPNRTLSYGNTLSGKNGCSPKAQL